MNRNLQNTVEQLRLWLTANGCKVRTSHVCHTPVLEVSGPLPREMQARAVWGRECLAGVVHEVAMMRFGGCLLHWRQ